MVCDVRGCWHKPGIKLNCMNAAHLPAKPAEHRPKGHVHVADRSYSHDRVINVGEPWSVTLLENSGIPSPYRLDPVRGSHLVLERKCPQAYLLEVPDERRIFFVLPWKGKTLVGTTEVRQHADAPVECSASERDYLVEAYNHYTTAPLDVGSVNSDFSGLRPLLYSASDPNKATREYALERNGQLLNVFWGKWTTSLALARKVQQHLL